MDGCGSPTEMVATKALGTMAHHPRKKVECGAWWAMPAQLVIMTSIGSSIQAMRVKA